MRTTVHSLALAAALTLLSGCGTKMQNPVTGENERSVMSESAEIEEGKRGHEQVLAEYGALKNPALQAYVNDVGQRLAKQSHRASLKWTFTVLDSPEINAFALPGGYIYITRGIMAYLYSEADMAGVIGHEIGHVTARHGAQRATRQQKAGLGVLAASVLGAVLEAKGVSGAGQMASQASQTAAAGYVARYGREQELQADGLGAQYLARSNFDPRNMVDVVNVLKNQERFAADLAKTQGRAVPQQNPWLASHPSNDERLAEIKQLAAQYKDSGKYADEGRARFQQAMQGVAFGESAEQGLTRGRNFYHEGLGFAVTAPVGWHIQNEQDQLAVVNATGDTALVLTLAPPAAGRTPEEVIKNMIKPTEGRADALRLNGLNATHFVGARLNANGQRTPVEVTVVSGIPGGIVVLGYAGKDAATVQRNRVQLQETEASFRPMGAAERAAAKPWSLKLVPYPRGGFAELARSSPLANAQQQLRLINGVYDAAEPQVGQMVKIVQ